MPRPVSNPPNPWHTTRVEWLGAPPAAELVVYEERARSVLTENDSPDVSLRWSVNPYRGCFHACAYCYARPSHQYLDFGAGTDFERRIVVKTNAPELLSVELARPSLSGQWIAFSGNTDCYQPLEASYELTRRCLEVCHARRRAAGIITKSALVRRDADLLADMARGAGARVWISIPFLDEARARAIEPHAPTPAKRFQALRALSDAGVPTGVAVAPILPGLNDSDLAGILERAADAGATHAFRTLVRLPGPVREVFEERLRATMPERADHVLSAIRDTRGGALTTGRFHDRMRGKGPRWELIERMFDLACRRHGLNRTAGVEAPAERSVQGELF